MARFCIVLFILFFTGLQVFAKSQKYYLVCISTDQPKQLPPYKAAYTDSSEIKNEVERVHIKLQKKGYLLSSVDSVFKHGDSVIVSVFVGTRFNNGSLVLGPELIDAAGYAGLPKRRKINMRQYVRRRAKLVDYFQNQGYPFAELYLDSLTWKGNAPYAQVRVEKNGEWSIAEILFSEPLNVKNTYVHKQINIEIGESYSKGSISDIPIRVNALPFLEMAGEPSVRFHKSGLASLYIPVNKVRSNSFDGILGFAPKDEENAELIVTGDINLILENALKKGESLLLKWQKLDEYSQTAKVNGHNKYLFDTRLGAGAAMDIEKQDTSFLNIQADLETGYYFKGFSDVMLLYSNVQRNVIRAEVYDSISNTISFLPARTNLFGVKYSFSRLDSRYNPSRGVGIRTTVKSGAKQYFQPEDVPDSVFMQFGRTEQVLEFENHSALYFPIKYPLVFKLAFQGRYMYTNTLLKNELYRFGGAKSLRGFNESVLFASAYGIGTFEFRVLIDRMSSIYAFYEMAAYEDRSVGKGLVDTPWGTGVGFNIASRNSIFSISYAVGKQFENPINFSAGKIHFGYLNRF